MILPPNLPLITTLEEMQCHTQRLPNGPPVEYPQE